MNLNLACGWLQAGLTALLAPWTVMPAAATPVPAMVVAPGVPAAAVAEHAGKTEQHLCLWLVRGC